MHYAKQKKPVSKGYLLYDPFYMIVLVNFLLL
jgi:hypothetical protein